jgi:hypothetical protein
MLWEQTIVSLTLLSASLFCKCLHKVIPATVHEEKLYWKHVFLLISIHWLPQYFVTQSRYKTLAMQTCALTCTRYFYCRNVIISHPTVGRSGLPLRTCYRFSVFPSLPRNGQRSSELFGIHCRSTSILLMTSGFQCYCGVTIFIC